MYEHALVEKCRELRRCGLSYREICAAINLSVPKGTMGSWFKGMWQIAEMQEHIRLRVSRNLATARQAAAIRRRAIREEKEELLRSKCLPIVKEVDRPESAKLVLAALYWAEGSKRRKGSLVFGNSDPGMVSVFMNLLRTCYVIDETKVRITVQCRADQNTRELEAYWSGITGIPREQFYAAAVDSRTKGKPTRRLDYKGVCRIDYFSSEVYRELCVLIKMLQET